MGALFTVWRFRQTSPLDGAAVTDHPALPAAAAEPREQQFSRLDQRELVAAAGLGIALAMPGTPLPPDRNPYLVYRRALTNPSSRRALISCLDRIAALLTAQAGHGQIPGELLPWHELRFGHTTAIRALVLEQGWSPAYARKHLAALRKVLDYAWRLELMSAEDYHRAVQLAPIPGSHVAVGRSVANTELAALLRVCAEDPRPTGARDAALIALLYSTGGRCFEVAAVQVEDYDPGDRSLLLTGKGGKQRHVYVQEAAAEFLGRWLAISDCKAGPLLLRIDRWGRIYDQGISAGAIGKRIKARHRQAGLPRLTPHDFRRTFIGDLLDLGADLATAQALAGHASPATTARYDRRPERTRRAAVDRLRFPAVE
ncbi:tyrosine-type recombinase/integrase [Spirillospora sp. CA-294931]|uniref:tyrosine-type recombinase/integrase n=1 Tax=Spirillospora sp. CA-294931 TaxID=3240042 RepID=UPI003D9112D8